jgi:transposase
MDIHDNARTTRHSRMLMAHRLASGWSVAAVAAAQGVTAKTVRKWRDRYATQGEAGLTDRCSRPHHSPRRLAARTAATCVIPPSQNMRRQVRMAPD